MNPVTQLTGTTVWWQARSVIALAIGIAVQFGVDVPALFGAPSPSAAVDTVSNLVTLGAGIWAGLERANPKTRLALK